MARLGGRVILDEVQEVPGIFEYMKMEIDLDRQAGRFILTGAAQFTMVRGVVESLAAAAGTTMRLTAPWLTGSTTFRTISPT
ncbi:MAG: hypothetical protein NT080_09505 [Spirochaetes bacterium]|nr:hypothetical protein [Spirochaetota bacterium]